jgi:sterol desaturase/sphingolipid hydroxylase (fatty acid hydroxylase superfamily)
MIVAAFVVAFLVASFAAYGVHRMMHRPWSGFLYKAHMEHHLVHYPIENLYSTKKYRSSGIASGWVTFTPLMLLVGAGVYIGLRALGSNEATASGIIALLGFVGWAHGYVHDAFHVRGHWLGRFRFFRQLREMHEPHHRDMRKNLGILFFWWDRVFGTLSEISK